MSTIRELRALIADMDDDAQIMVEGPYGAPQSCDLDEATVVAVRGGRRIVHRTLLITPLLTIPTGDDE